ncbi:MAG: VWA domain-containing protein, partial [Acidobacteria bacterium]
MFTRRCFFGVLAVIFFAQVLQPSFPQRRLPGTIRVDVTAVPLDVIVTDTEGKPVTGLSQEDFLVLENQVPQQITHFSVSELGPGRQAPVQVGSVTDPASTGVSLPTFRNFLIVLGRGRHSQNFDTMKQLIRFVSDQLAPEDQVAVVAYGRATAFTTNHQLIVALLERFSKENPYIETTLENTTRGLAAIYGVRRPPAKTQARINNIFAVEGLVSNERLTANLAELEGQSEGDREAFATNQQVEINRRIGARDRAGLETLERQNMEVPGSKRFGGGVTPFDILSLSHLTDLPFEEYMGLRGSSSQDLENIFSAIEYLRFVEGEKHLLFLTGQGLFLPHLEDDESIASAASDARVRIHVVQTGGIDIRDVTGGVIAPIAARPAYDLGDGGLASNTMSFALSSLHNIANLTGGQAFTRTDIGEAFRSIGEATRLVYMLAYRPANTNFDGRFRHIQVSVRQRGLRVFARRGYYARPTVQAYDRIRFMTYLRTAAAAQYPERVHDIPLDADIDKKRIGDGRIEVAVKVKIKVRDSFFEPKDEMMAGYLAVNYFIINEDGEMKAEAWNTLNVKVGKDKYQEALQQPVVAQQTFQ